MADWQRLGQNIQEEWIEENPQGQRRVCTPAGPIMEPSTSDMRWGRLSSTQDATYIAQALSYPNIFQSYSSLDAACAVWSTPQGRRTSLDGKAAAPFRTLVEQAMARRVWSSMVAQQWSSNLPDWHKALQRFGLFAWPLWMDVGVFRHIYTAHPSTPALDEYAKWAITERNQQKLHIVHHPLVGATPTVVVEGWSVSHAALAKAFPHHDFHKNGVLHCSLQEWTGERPPLVENDVWENVYRPFSSAVGQVSGYVDPLLNQAQRCAHPMLPATSVRAHVASVLGFSNDPQLSAVLSDDQIDAVWLAHQQLAQKKSFLLADETGYGKGRIVASLAKLALKAGHQVLFFTEKKTLLSDFYRDCNTVFAPLLGENHPVIMHSSARVLDENGNLAIATKNVRSVQEKDQWVWTTYSQFNRANPEKLSALLKWMAARPTWVLMDEAQNAAGSSNTAKALKKIQQASAGVLFSSATFSKSEEQLQAYRQLFEGNKQEWQRLLSAFAADTDTLRAAITLMWAEQGVFLRREHPPMSLPEPQWIVHTAELAHQQEQFSTWWQLMLDCARLWNKSLSRPEGPWTKLGGHLSRAAREFSLLQKKDALVENIVRSHAQGQKTVVVSDWTLSSHVSRLVSANKEATLEDNGTEYSEQVALGSSVVRLPEKPMWAKSWMQVVHDIFSDEELRCAPGPARANLQHARQKIVDHLAGMPAWSISPFDDLLEEVSAHGLKMGEISGRSWCLAQDNEGWYIHARSEEHRSKTVQAFNNGTFDSVLLTRAGNSGISLHAGQQFKDQRQRHLIEWDVAPDASVRLQFWGRVRRKDQINEPQRSTLLVDTPAERRRLHRDTAKQKRLTSHSGTMNTTEGGNWIGPNGSFVAKDWVSNHPTANAILDPWPDVQVEKVLARSVVLPSSDRNNLLVHLSQGVDLLQDWSPKRLPQWDLPSHAARMQWWWGNGAHALHWQQRVWAPRRTASKEQVLDELQTHHQGKSQSAQTVVNIWKTLWKEWWDKEPQQRTSPRVQCLEWWAHHASMFERGRAIEATDPSVGGRARGIVLGWQPPASMHPEDWGATQIGMWVWMNTMDQPMLLSLAAWMSGQYAGAKPLATAPQPTWFTGEPTPTTALTLVGPPWSVAAWGARHAPHGQLMHMHDDTGQWTWGWTMPNTWSWDMMLDCDRELAGVHHAHAFLRDRPQSLLRWRWTPRVVLEATPQSGGLLLSGRAAALECIAFPLLRQCGVVKWDNTRTQWFLLMPWRLVKAAFAQWSASGAIPTIPAEHHAWHAQTWSKYAHQ